jgi:dipeptidyl-peptidase-4
MEAFYGLPQNNPERYEKASLLRLVKSLKGKLLLIHPTGDVACPFSHTMKMVDALIQAGKPYDLLIFPEEVHGLYRKPESYKYYLLAVLRYFVEHLKPDNN